MIEVIARKGENVESLYGRFKKLCKKDGLFLRINEKSFYMKPSEKRRLKQKRRKKQGDN